MRIFVVASILTLSMSFTGTSTAVEQFSDQGVFSDEKGMSFTFNSETTPKAINVLLQKDKDTIAGAVPCYNFECKGPLCTATIVSLDGC